MQNIQNRHWVSRSWVPGASVPPAAAGQHQAVPDWPWQQTGTELRDVWIGIWSGLLAGRRAGSSSEGRHGQRERDPHDPPALNWVQHAWHGIPGWSVWSHLSCPPLPTSATSSNSSLAAPKRSVVYLGCHSNNSKQGPFSAFLSYC